MGYYNLNRAAGSCTPCHNFFTCAVGIQSSSNVSRSGGILVPQDGFWHANPFSPQVRLCAGRYFMRGFIPPFLQTHLPSCSCMPLGARNDEQNKVHIAHHKPKRKPLTMHSGGPLPQRGCLLLYPQGQRHQ